jgi:beta-glucanase (GH16 family)
VAKARIRHALLALVVLLLGGALLAVPGQAVTTGATATAAAPYCGTAIYKRPDGTRMRCSFADSFSGTAVNSSRWRVITSQEADWGRRTDCFVNSRNNLAIGGGILKLTTRRGLAPFSCGPASRRYTATATSVTLTSYGKYSQKYGRVQIRARFPYAKVPGLQSALWMWPVDAQGAMLGMSGEIDIAEYYSKWWDRVIPYLHYATSFLSPSQATNNKCLVASAWNWHTYVLEWQPNGIYIKFDGHLCLHKSSGGSPFNKSYFMSLTQSQGVGRNAATSQTPKVATMQIDYVRMWS